MKARFYFEALVGFVVCLLLFPGPTLAVKSQEEKGSLLQYNTSFTGPVDLFIDNSGSQAYLQDRVHRLIFRPPDYLFGIIVNDENKSYMRSVANPTFAVMGAKLKLRSCKAIFIGKSRLSGLACEHHKLTRAGEVVADVWSTEKLKAVKPLLKALTSTLDMPPECGVPLKVWLTADGARYKDRFGTRIYTMKNPYLQLVSIKQVPTRTRRFKLTGYKQAQDLTTLMFSNDGDLGKEDIEDLFHHRRK